MAMNRSTFLIQNTTVITLLFSLIMLISCSKEDKCPYDRQFHSGECFFNEESTAKLRVNDIEIDDHVMPRVIYNRSEGVMNFLLYSMILHPESRRWETSIHITMQDIPFEVGKKPAVDLHINRPDSLFSNSFVMYYMNIDAITAFYDFDEEAQDSYVELLEIDEEKNTVKGQFDIMFIKKEQYSGSWPPQEVRTRGEFLAKYNIRE